MDELPPEVTEAIEKYLSTLGNVHSQKAMSGLCMDASYGLAKALKDLTYLDEYGDEETVTASPIQLWDAPRAIAENPMAPGHYVCRIKCRAGTWYMDCTAAQFPELGHRGPAISPSIHWSDFEPFNVGK